MKLSIIVPIYNVEHYLRQCLDSVIKQAYGNMEILLVDDGSTDTSGEISREYELNCSFVRLITKRNGGLSDARNTGIRESTGDYILFLDADDYWETDFLQDLMQRTIENPELDYILFRYKKFYQNAGRYEETFHDKELHKCKGSTGAVYLNAILRKNRKFNWFAWQGLVRREFLLENELFFQVEKNYEDVLWTPQVLLKAEYVDFFDRAVYIYRLERDGQITSDFSLENLKGRIYVSSFWYRELQKYTMDKELKHLLMKNLTTQFFVAIWFAGFLKDQEKNEILTLLKRNKNLLSYSNGAVSKITAILCGKLGFTVSLEILKRSVAVKRYIKRRKLSLKYGLSKSGVMER